MAKCFNKTCYFWRTINSYLCLQSPKARKKKRFIMYVDNKFEEIKYD